MSTELIEVTSKEITRVISQDSEYDDTLEVPDSLEITVDENGKTIQICKKEIECQDNEEKTLGTIPFTAIHNLPTKFKNQNCNVFIFDEEIQVRIIDNERSVTTHPLNPNLYTIEFKHGPFIWIIKKRYKHIQYLHNQLKIYRASLNIPFPTKSHREKRNNLGTGNEKRRKRNALPRFPNKPDILVPYEQLNHRRKELEDYLYNLLNIEIYRRHPETINFLDISRLSFVVDLGMKGKEGTILKRTGSGSRNRCSFCGLFECSFCIKCNYLCTSLCGKWHKRHLIVKETFVTYLTKDGRIKSVILMDNGFGISFGIYSTGSRSGIQIANLSRHIVIKCWTKRKAKEWMEFIQEICNKEGKDFIQTNPHNSFAPYRSSISAIWFVDGANYMAAVADALENAKEEIFIADWWLSPEIYMKRPMFNGDYWRLDKILQRKAFEGVKIFILIYKEIEVALGINSYYSKQRLVQQCPDNIKVLRHPDHARAGIFLWAHHEKIVVIDQSLAFLGGIDLCYGRWDNSEHRLIDLESIHQSSIYIPSKDKLTNTSSKKVLTTCNTDRHVLLPLAIATNTIAMVTARSMPLLPMIHMDNKTQKVQISTLPMDNSLFMLQEKDDSIKCNTPELQRKNLFDVAKTTVDKMKNTVKVKRQELIHMMYSSHEADASEDVDNNQILSESEDTVDYACNLKPTKLWLGKDYTNFIVKDFNDLEKPYQDLIDRTTTPRMPWHDIGILVQNSAARDVARHFIQRWNAVKLEKANLNPCYPYLLPKSYKHCRSFAPFIKEANKHNVKCQVLRSVSSWSAGFLDPETVEQSIQEAYIHAISKAERYIYIENQFFITLASMDKGFEGEVGGPSGTALRAITHWNYASISRGKDAILNQLIEAGVEDPSEYITFHGLRTHSMLNGTMVTELIYVHSKLIIIDDNTVICGSANINDRSMVATRDSEIAVIIHDQEFEDGRMNDIPFLCGKFASSLRKQLFREHLGLLNTTEDINIDDAIIKSFYKDIWCARSKQNTKIYEEVFQCIPTDKVVNFSMLKQYQDEIPISLSDPLLAQEIAENIKGHLVDLPLHFLRNEDLKPAASTVEGMMPTALWT
ncbi:phospholipase D1 isoform X2 [Anoplolepis gracilipes]|uniref:phospholipase D1 isoform X2 n=1 Tax=Anoplolepis gracilipes TaxID=354296 RepID=UPI003BA2C9E7